MNAKPKVLPLSVYWACLRRVLPMQAPRGSLWGLGESHGSHRTSDSLVQCSSLQSSRCWLRCLISHPLPPRQFNRTQYSLCSPHPLTGQGKHRRLGPVMGSCERPPELMTIAVGWGRKFPLSGSSRSTTTWRSICGPHSRETGIQQSLLVPRWRRLHERRRDLLSSRRRQHSCWLNWAYIFSVLRGSSLGPSWPGRRNVKRGWRVFNLAEYVTNAM